MERITGTLDVNAYLEKFHQPALFHTPRNPWEEQLDNFLAKLNPGRERDGYDPYTHSRMAGILGKQGIRTADEAYRFFKKCDSGRSFSRLFSYFTKNPHA